MRRREHMIFVLLFTAAVGLVFFNVASLKQGLLKADYLQQLYPWSAITAESLKSFQLPLWIRWVGCGFPLFAEGQTGVIYPPNLLMFFLLPFRPAYNYSFLVHFILSGVFTYFLARKKGACLWGGALAAVLICFGSAYAGCFIHLASLRALTWFPLVLLLYDIYLEKGKKGPFIPLIGLIAGMQLVSGSAQMAAYSIFFYALYFFHRNGQEGYRSFSGLKDLLAALALALAIALPQIHQTLIMTAHSNRKTLMSLDFALWNSFSPLALSGSVMPYIGRFFSKHNVIYVGSIGLFFSMVSLWRSAKDREIRPFVVMLVAALFLALGKYNPFYVIALEITHFFSFRAPSRALYFAVFPLSVLAGTGFSFFLSDREKVPDALYRFFSGILLAAAAFFLAAKAALRFLGPWILEAAKAYVKNNVYGKAFHRYDLDAYMAKTEGIFETAESLLSFGNPRTVMTLALLASALALVFLFRKHRWKGRSLALAGFIFICAELTFYGSFGKGIWPELDSFAAARPAERLIFRRLSPDKELYRVCPFGSQAGTPSWLRPSMNALYGIDSVAIYSPLTGRDYCLTMKGLGVVDDSIGIYPREKDVLYSRVDLLRELNVKYVASTEELRSGGLSLIAEDKGLYLYGLNGYMPRFYFTRGDAAGSEAPADIRVLQYKSGSAELEVKNDSPGLLVFSEKFFPGWQARVDGEKAPILRRSLIIQAVRLSAGEHTVIFKYAPRRLRAMLIFSAAVFLAALAGVIMAAVFGAVSGRKT